MSTTLPEVAPTPPRAGLRSLIFLAVAAGTAWLLGLWLGSGGAPLVDAVAAADSRFLRVGIGSGLATLPALAGGLAAWLLPRPLGRVAPRPGSRAPAAAWSVALALILTAAAAWVIVGGTGRTLQIEFQWSAALAQGLGTGIPLALALLPLVAAWRSAPRVGGALVSAVCFGAAAGAGWIVVNIPFAVPLPGFSKNVFMAPLATWTQPASVDLAWAKALAVGVGLTLVALGLAIALGSRSGLARWAVSAAFFLLVSAPDQLVPIGEIPFTRNVQPWWDLGQLYSNLPVQLIAAVLLCLAAFSGAKPRSTQTDLGFIDGYAAGGTSASERARPGE